ncbi:MAG: cytochrome b/b6 domain-containing protein [Armatimonadota bacterium]|nr:cytochrome b/b6 domain-containing protein [bacterium]
MQRYGISASAISSYEHSYHGRAFLHFGQTKSATCTDCHGAHSILAPNNAGHTCTKCHHKTKNKLAAPGVSHLALRINDSPLLKIERLFFKTLTLTIMLCLAMMITFDLYGRLFRRSPSHKTCRLIAILIALGFYCLVGGIAIAAFNLRAAQHLCIVWAIMTASAYIIHKLRQPSAVKKRSDRYYTRFNLAQRAQHILLAGSFTLLVITGMPLRYADISWTHHFNTLFGGFQGARIAHRVGAIILIITWIWHCIDLIFRWKQTGFSLKSWSMWPNRKDITDLIHTIQYNLSLQPERPHYDRFHFRQKFDYLAVCWGMPIMVASGLVLWFPAAAGSLLPSIAQPVAWIAHSDEALLAMLAIVVWHLYNVHLNPDNFPSNQSWLTGKLSESEMEREHPLEKARIDAKHGV